MTPINLNNFLFDAENLKFISELELAKMAHEDSWFHCDCGHDCCPCNSECK
jgi:hypothetical protein